MNSDLLLKSLLLTTIVCARSLAAQQAAATETSKSATDELIFINGERLLGHFERSDGATLVFKSDMAGEVTTPWSKVKELHSTEKFAVVPKGVKFGRRRTTDQIPEGQISVSGQTLQIASGTGEPKAMPVSDTGYVIAEPTFVRSLNRPSLFEAWKGSATAGVSLVLATQKDRSYTSAITLSRSIPTEPWMNPENRTTFNFSSSYGELTQPGEPMTKTSIYHADAERDEYFTPRLYSFLAAAFDHNFSQGLDLEQTLGGGLGWTVVKGQNEQFDLKAELTYVDQQFQLAAQNQHLVGSVFSEDYDHTFRHGIIFHESLSISPAWNNTNAYSTTGNVLFTIPVSKHFSVTLNTLDTFLNNPSPGFKKNSFQYTTGLTYTLP